MRLLHRREQRRDPTFERPRADATAEHRLAAGQLPIERGEHALRDHRHAGHDEDVLPADAGRAGPWVLDQLGTVGRARHAQARVGQLIAVIGTQDFGRLRVDDDGHTDSRGDRVDGDVVVRRPDATGGENIIACGPHRINRLGDGRHVVGDDAHLLQPDALHVEPLGEIGEVRILRAPRQDLVANDDEGGGIDTVRRGGRHSARFSRATAACTIAAHLATTTTASNDPSTR